MKAMRSTVKQQDNTQSHPQYSVNYSVHCEDQVLGSIVEEDRDDVADLRYKASQDELDHQPTVTTELQNILARYPTSKNE